ncbi:probable E3 ubiquitin-protein ligase XERICO [Salvia miltiorrhiza]|uniref:probable E3 ubiquitin-protein ligase XERICO n=1 Tax=Salvia miltiorrhiza TaxID=226208 RepID=UPI0025AC9B20|nr:probable E3 ubiquitin-protein ligase XERICO [Salvia miltiorrhiza]
MGLSNFPSPAEGVLPLLVMNTVMSVALVKNKLRSVLQAVGGGGAAEEARRVSITRYGCLCREAVECCVCLCKFEAEEEVSELSCKHFFHKPCLDKWFDNQHITCPLCRSIL